MTSGTLSLVFFRGIRGLHIGTFILAVVLGTIIGAVLRFMEKYIEGTTIFPEEKTEWILGYDLLNRKTAKNEDSE